MKQPELFDGVALDSPSGKARPTVQLVSELLTDTACVAGEARRGLDPDAVV